MYVVLLTQTINLFHMGPEGWKFIANYDVMDCTCPD